LSKVSVHQRKARDFIQREDWDNALSELERMLGSEGSNPTLHNQIGDVYLRKDDVQMACEHFERAIEQYAEVGLHNNAVALCKKVMRLRPGRLEVRYRLARLRLDQGFRAEAAQHFSDWLDHIHPKSEVGGAELEARCRDIVELLPEDAPVGKVLEKLESAQHFQAAFDIVRKFAQLATDAGDEAAARRYTEKMRSLRVLVERSGGRDLLAEPPGAAPAAEAGAEPAPSPPASEARLEPAEPAASAQPVDEIQIDLPEPERSAPGAAATDVPAAGDAAASEAAAAMDEDAAPGGALRERRAPRRWPADLDLTPQPEGEGDAAESSDGEYELPETTFDEVQELLAAQAAAEPVPAEPTAVHPIFAEEPAEDVEREFSADPHTIDLGPPPALQRPPAGPVRRAEPPAAAPEPALEPPRLADDAAVPEPVAMPAPEVDVEAGPAAAAAPAADLAPWPVPAPPPVPPRQAPAWAGPEPSFAGPAAAPPAQPVTNWVDALRRAPVWIPGDSDTTFELPANHEASSSELEHVIDSFREQMSRALEGDGEARYDLGVAYYEMGLYNEALAEFEAAARAPGLEVRSLEMLASCLLQQGRHSELVELLVPVLAADGHTPRGRLGLQYALGLACEALGDLAQARRHFEEVAQVDSDFKDVQARLQRT
jgi:tetratricopeptide (TPR) repeat protein